MARCTTTQVPESARCRRAAVRAACSSSTIRRTAFRTVRPTASRWSTVSGQVLEFLSYEGVVTATAGPAAGRRSDRHRRGGDQRTPSGNSLQRNSAGVWAPGASSFGACNPEVPIPVGNSLSFSRPRAHRSGAAGRLRRPDLRDAAQPDQRHDSDHHHLDVGNAGDREHRPERRDACARRGHGDVARDRADGTTATYSLPTRVAVASGVAYPGNTEFGEPADARCRATTSSCVTSSSRRRTTRTRGTPNWVSYDLDAAHFGAEDRCDCFTMDPDLPVDVAAHLHQRLHGRRRVPRVRHRSRPHGAFVRPHHGQPRQRAHLSCSATSCRRRPT